jgi:AcrR family transcriptional regulator
MENRMLSMSTSRRAPQRKNPKKAPVSGPGEPYHHGNLRAALLDAAGKILEENGPDALSLREVARRLGVSHNAPYRHFATRDELLAALAAEGFRALGEATGKARAAAGPDDNAVNWMGLAYIDFALKNPARYRLMFGGSKADTEELATSAKESFLRVRGAIAQSGAPSADLAAVRAWAQVHGIAHLLLDKQINAALMGGRTPLEFAALLLVGTSDR